MKVEVFAKLKDYFEKAFEVEIEILTVSDLQQHLISMNPASRGILKICRFAINNEIVPNNFQLKNTDHVSIIPPSSGG